MNLSLNGYGTGYVTLEAAEGLTEGVLAKISANHTAAAAGDGEAFIGPVLSVRDGLALVQLSGICTVAYTGGAPTLGYDMLAADASGGIKTTEAGGRTVLVTAVDSTAMTAEILL